MSLYQSQKAVKPKIEDVVGDFLNKDLQKNLMDFLGFLQENKLTPRWQSSNSWKVSYKGKGICFIKIVEPSSWFVMHSAITSEKWLVGYDAYFSDELKAFIWKNVKGGWCPNNCKGRSRTFFGKEFNDVCTCWGVRTENPSGAALENSKKVVLAVKNFIADLPVESKAN